MPSDLSILGSERAAAFAAISARVAHWRNGEVARVQNTIEPFDVDFRTVGEFYRKIESAFSCIEPERLFIGDPAEQASPQYLDFPKELVQVSDVASAKRAIEMIIEQGESPTSEHPDAHFCVFNTIRTEYMSLVEAARAKAASSIRCVLC